MPFETQNECQFLEAKACNLRARACAFNFVQVAFGATPSERKKVKRKKKKKTFEFETFIDDKMDMRRRPCQ